MRGAARAEESALLRGYFKQDQLSQQLVSRRLLALAELGQ